jgi:stress response protein YsnF
MSNDLRIPIVEEEATVRKRSIETERVNVRTFAEEEQVVVRDEVRREHVEVTRVLKDEQVTEAPAVRVEGDITIVPVLEERLVVEKRLFLVEELHLRRTVSHDVVDLPTTLRRTRVEVEREDLEQRRDVDGTA